MKIKSLIKTRKDKNKNKIKQASLPIPRNVLTKILLSVLISRVSHIKFPNFRSWSFSKSRRLRSGSVQSLTLPRPNHLWANKRPQPMAVQLPANHREPRQRYWPPVIGNYSRWSSGKGRRRTCPGRSLWKKLARTMACPTRRRPTRLLMLTLISSLALHRWVISCDMHISDFFCARNFFRLYWTNHCFVSSWELNFAFGGILVYPGRVSMFSLIIEYFLAGSGGISGFFFGVIDVIWD